MVYDIFHFFAKIDFFIIFRYLYAQKFNQMGRYDEIFEAFRKGELAPFYRRMYPELILFAGRILGHDYAFMAEDHVQDSVFKAYERRNSFVSAMQWKVFLYTCVRNAAISCLRHRSARQNYLAQTEVSDDALALGIVEQETISMLYEAIESLPPEYRELLEMSFGEGLRNAEIASRLQVAEITVKKRKARLIDLLRESMGGKVDKEYLLLLLYLLMQE